MDKGPQRAGDPDHERADGKGRELGAERADADDLGGDVHVAGRHPHPPDPPAHQVLGGERDDREQ